MITPRTPLPYKSLEELVNDSITIRTRSYDVRFAAPDEWLEIHKPHVLLNTERSEAHSTCYSPKSERRSYELLCRYSEVESLRNAAAEFTFSHKVNNLADLLYRASSLIPLNLTFFRHIIKTLKLNNEGTIEENNFRNNILRAELEQLNELLRSCQKSALVLTTYHGFQLMKKFESEGHENVYQGEEIYYQMYIAFIVKGLVPQYLVQRVKYAERCGLWMRWRSLFKPKFLRKNDRRSRPLEKPTLRGNVVMIFMLLCAGLVMSLFCFCVESTLKKTEEIMQSQLHKLCLTELMK